jgi:translation initiation factor 1
MARPNKQKISTDGGAAVGGGLFQAFSGLDIGGLPEGPSEEKLPEKESKPAKLGRVVLRRETAHRGGKCVIVIDGFEPTLDEVFLSALLKRLRTACGCGGTLKERALELQGDHPQRIRELLVSEGFRVAGVS